MNNSPTQPSQQVPVEMTPIDALRNLVNAIGGGKKACGHQFDCSCAFNDARALLAQSVPAAIDVRDAEKDACGFILVRGSAIDWLKEKYPALCIKAGLCEQIVKRLYTVTRLQPPPQTGKEAQK